MESKLNERDQLIEEQKAKIAELEPPVPQAGDYDSSRIICPMCNSVEVKDVEDKSKVLSYIGHLPLYAKKHQCRKCGYEWQ